MATEFDTPGPGADYREICGFCAELQRRSDHNMIHTVLGTEIGFRYILWETRNFAVIPCIGSLVPGYLLIVPRSHILSFGFVPRTQDDELNTLAREVRAWLWRTYRSPVVTFEHGAASFRARGGACTDHAHLHLMPLEESGGRLREQLDRDFTTESVAGYPAAARQVVCGQGRPYLYVADGGKERICGAEGAKTQYFRRLVADYVGSPDTWDWAADPHPEHMFRTIRDRWGQGSI